MALVLGEESAAAFANSTDVMVLGKIVESNRRDDPHLTCTVSYSAAASYSTALQLEVSASGSEIFHTAQEDWRCLN
jgi:hypothetical protein